MDGPGLQSWWAEGAAAVDVGAGLCTTIVNDFRFRICRTSCLAPFKHRHPAINHQHPATSDSPPICVPPSLARAMNPQRRVDTIQSLVSRMHGLIIPLARRCFHSPARSQAILEIPHDKPPACLSGRGELHEFRNGISTATKCQRFNIHAETALGTGKVC